MFGVFIILLFMGILPADMSVYRMHVVSRGQKDPPPKLELWVVVNCYVGAGTSTKAATAFNHKPSLHFHISLVEGMITPPLPPTHTKIGSHNVQMMPSIMTMCLS